MPAIFFFAAEHLYGVLVTSNFITVPNFAVLFLAHGQTVIMDFSFCESEMMLWKVMLRRLIKTIR
jgi:hypothetical protein